jgi:hypothetical protein
VVNEMFCYKNKNSNGVVISKLYGSKKINKNQFLFFNFKSGFYYTKTIELRFYVVIVVVVPHNSTIITPFGYYSIV